MDRGTTKKAGWLTAEEYDFIFSRVPRFCVDLVVKNKQGEILYSLREIEPYKGKWHLPGGKVNFRESITEAIQRIAKAELNSEVTIHKMLGYMEFLEEVQDGKDRHTVSVAFLAELVEENPSGSWQGQKLQFFLEIPENAHPIHANFLKSIK